MLDMQFKILLSYSRCWAEFYLNQYLLVDGMSKYKYS